MVEAVKQKNEGRTKTSVSGHLIYDQNLIRFNEFRQWNRTILIVLRRLVVSKVSNDIGAPHPDIGCLIHIFKIVS